MRGYFITPTGRLLDAIANSGDDPAVMEHIVFDDSPREAFGRWLSVLRDDEWLAELGASADDVQARPDDYCVVWEMPDQPARGAMLWVNNPQRVQSPPEHTMRRVPPDELVGAKPLPAVPATPAGLGNNPSA